MTKLSKNSHFDLDPNTLKRKLVRGIVIPNTCVKLYQNWIIHQGTRVMIKGENTNIHTGQTLYPLHNFVVRGDNKSCEILVSQILKAK